MILFAADNHYGTHPGRAWMKGIGDRYDIDFNEDDWRCFLSDGLRSKYELIILNMIGGSCEVPPPKPECESNVKDYVEQGGSFLLLHGSSAAFWQRSWWREFVGYRWVRANDPDGVVPSTHPHRPYRLKRSKARHELMTQLQEVDLPEDEIYINLEQTAPATVLMETTTDEGTFPQCYETRTPWGGRIIGFLPGHKAEVIEMPEMTDNVTALIDYLLQTGTETVA